MYDQKKHAALHLRLAIENGQDGIYVLSALDQLAISLGGTCSVIGMDPAAAQLYVISLMLTQPELG